MFGGYFSIIYLLFCLIFRSLKVFCKFLKSYFLRISAYFFKLEHGFPPIFREVFFDESDDLLIFKNNATRIDQVLVIESELSDNYSGSRDNFTFNISNLSFYSSEDETLRITRERRILDLEAVVGSRLSVRTSKFRDIFESMPWDMSFNNWDSLFAIPPSIEKVNKELVIESKLAVDSLKSRHDSILELPDISFNDLDIKLKIPPRIKKINQELVIESKILVDVVKSKDNFLLLPENLSFNNLDDQLFKKSVELEILKEELNIESNFSENFEESEILNIDRLILLFKKDLIFWDKYSFFSGNRRFEYSPQPFDNFYKRKYWTVSILEYLGDRLQCFIGSLYNLDPFKLNGEFLRFENLLLEEPEQCISYFTLVWNKAVKKYESDLRNYFNSKYGLYSFPPDGFNFLDLDNNFNPKLSIQNSSKTLPK